ncbi:TetR/AcrR family transcriptional regulator [Acidovorax sp. DW039]|uniref:TetR/AcrR family transcriptional regulator n=1 Tax=Acidovorax sp. DW039 TaxID=3095606 RepID=UPI003092EE88|nr:TetR/AcrR family transcriptional regulator [Acidovorax sp. DW039]
MTNLLFAVQGHEPDLASMGARERILHTAHMLFYREGIRATGIDRIIAEARVTKVTFYRQFPSKQDLVVAYLEHRHAVWMQWFRSALEQPPADGSFALQCVVQAMQAWFEMPDFRGCAFINGVAEAEGLGAEVVDIARRHKREMTQAIAAQLPPDPAYAALAEAVAMAVDGAIVRVQMTKEPAPALRVLEALLRALWQSAGPAQ